METEKVPVEFAEDNVFNRKINMRELKAQTMVRIFLRSVISF